jgi:phospholipase D1/2
MNKMNYFKDLFKADNEIETIINDKYVKKGSVPSNVQVLRSSGEWSLGLKSKENSILEAYYQLIENSKHYIYIENQFFISRSFDDKEYSNNKGYIVENKIALYLVNRILKASRNHEKFRVYVFIPLLPGFEGEPEKSGTLQIILKYTYESICRHNKLSIVEKLQNEMEKTGQNWEDYIGFYSLRNHSYVNGIPRTEIIYIHSKLMIVDDLYVICGSANINDRSMNGSRDSEFAALIKERRTEISTINGKKYKTAKFASSLRKALLAEHLGINKNDIILNDPLSDELHELIRKTAHNNTFVYHQVFGCYPDDCYTKFSMIHNNLNIQNKAQEEYLKKNYEENKHKIVGHIVEFPLHFLEEEQLGISFFSRENLVPERNFT